MITTFNQLKIWLEALVDDNVIMNTFSDASGIVLFHLKSGETTAIHSQEITQQDFDNQFSNIKAALLAKGFIKDSD